MDIEAALRAELPPETIIRGGEIEPRYLGDWMYRDESARPAALVRPGCTADVSKALKICHSHGISVVPQGGRTGLAGGATPETGWVIIALERMRGMEPVDVAAGVIVVEAGAILQSVQQAADAAGLFFPLDIGGRGSCTIGGNMSTNAGGNRVLRYGMMRDLVLGLEAVLVDGTVLTSMNVMQKNNTGYDLKQLFVGSEGTLGVVTRAVLRLFPKPLSQQTALCAVDSYTDLVRLLRRAKEQLGGNLAAFEVMWPYFYRLGTDGLDVRAPLGHGRYAYVLVESMGTHVERDQLQFDEFVEAVMYEGAIADAVIAQSLKDSQEIWKIRDSSGEFQKTFWPYVGFDVSIPISQIGEFILTCEARLQARWANVQTLWFGHVADSNIHIGVRWDDANPLPEHQIDEIVYDCVGKYSGSISAEHGIGVLKRGYLDKSRSPAEIDTMRVLKRALDPLNLLNPGKIFLQPS